MKALSKRELSLMEQAYEAGKYNQTESLYKWLSLKAGDCDVAEVVSEKADESTD